MTNLEKIATLTPTQLVDLLKKCCGCPPSVVAIADDDTGAHFKQSDALCLHRSLEDNTPISLCNECWDVWKEQEALND